VSGQKWSIRAKHKGVQMRSRLEVRWAQFFDQHGMLAVYEGEGFDLGGVRYLPDFWLEDLRTFVEVKGALDGQDVIKMAALARAASQLGAMVVLAETDPGYSFRLVRVTDGAVELSRATALVKCFECDRWQFTDTEGRMECRACGAYREDFAHIAAVHPHGGRFPLAGDKCLQCGAIEGVLVRRAW
jgi:hypothetical protein